MVESIRPGPVPTVARLAKAGVNVDRTVPEKATPAPGGVPPRLSLAAALAQKGPPFDAEKVAMLNAAIASGEYRIDLGAVADGIIRFGGGTGD